MTNSHGPAGIKAYAKLVGSVALAIIAVGLLLANVFTVIFYATGNADLWPMPVAIGVGVGFAVFVPLSVLAIRRSAASLISFVETSPFEGLDTVTGPLPAYPTPADVRDVTAALVRLNELDLPYAVRAESARGRTEITVEWRSEELRWRTLFHRGATLLRWKMRLLLDEAAGTYSFTESRAVSKIEGSALSGRISGTSSWTKGKQISPGYFTSVWAVGQVSSPRAPEPTGRSP